MSDETTRARRVVTQMLAADAFSHWLGVELVDARLGHCTVRMTVRAEMVNGLGVCHGGIAYALADSAFAFACNAQGHVAVAVENTMRYPAPVHVGDVLTAVAAPDASSRRIGYYRVDVRNQRDETVAMFTGTSYTTSRLHFPDDSA